MSHLPLEKQLEYEILSRVTKQFRLPAGVSLSRQLLRCRTLLSFYVPDVDSFSQGPLLVVHAPDLGTMWEIWHARKQLFAVQERFGVASHIVFYCQDQIFGAAYCPPPPKYEWLDK